ncbi:MULTISPECIES: mannonate dehydratase [Hallella]|uniref:Mannonate dehydratase n=1 Tax=Hallella faecis TaxID=2841596 RepID=A0ABV1FT70_9BACT|nr:MULTISPECIES: mannonate dehydratase [Hallella]MBS7399824.1 mannonate dehydratase [Prevotella sp.]MBU0290845.1 mannonate dehydratase [Hallella faecis]MCI7433846.1 mannonate dehydratase [Prevotella sp.]MDD7145122.1 mannonate dehydratase [Hallella sp.]MDR3844488.1 mannonate dehydratase [Hallella sp.]
MERTWRWFGKNDPITLAMLKQIGVEGIVTALHDVPLGQVWTREKIHDLKTFIESYGMRWSVVESLPVTETIKYAGPDRDEQIDIYKQSLRNLAAEGIHTICYNFMPVLDWARTDLLHDNPNGSSNLYFSIPQFAYFDIYILKRQGAKDNWARFQVLGPDGKPNGRNIIEEVEQLRSTMTPEKDHALVENIVIKTQGFVSGNFKEDDEHPVELFRQLLALYKGIDRDQLRANMKYFLEAIMPVCEECDMYMCVHPDDPPFQVLGLPRIVTCDDDIQWFLNAVPNKHNGLTFCAGSLSAGAQNNVVEMARKYASRTWFVHLRSCHVFPNGDFTEASHLGGRADIIQLARVFEEEEERRKGNANIERLPMRVDHGMTMLGDETKGYNAGYSFLGRMFAMGQVQGIIATVDRELNKPFHQPGFFD